MSVAVVGGMTIDDIVLTRGGVHRRTPGGNALYTALGALVWGVSSQIVSFVGQDYPWQVLEELERRGIGTGHVRRVAGGSIRLWLLYEHDGRRQIHLQHDSPVLEPLADMAGAALRGLLGGADKPAAVHLAALPVQTQRPLAQILREAGVRFSLDTLEAVGTVGGDLATFLAPGGDLAPEAFLPSLEEFAAIFGDRDTPAFRRWAMGTVTEVLVVKDGAAGSLVSAPPAVSPVRVPALRRRILDPTGAGDAFCGGYLAGMALDRGPLECARMGTVSASFVIEQVGIHGLLAATPVAAARRLASLRGVDPR
jgi:sugar/nucleoside kinase (ribokinase family)